ncbi:MAG: hypothetical protein WB048_08360, partial [Pseudolabrys sp.]
QGKQPCPLSANSGHRVYSITSSARVSREAGIVMPNALAVFILITVSNFVGACTGKSVPSRLLILDRYQPEPRK